MSGHTERLCRTLHLLESVAGLQTDASPSGIAAQTNTMFVTNIPKIGRRKGGTSFERERQACLEMRELLIGWNGKGQQKQVEKRELSRRAIGALFLVLDHREQALRFAADQALDAIFRHFVLRSEASKVIAFVLTELNKENASARALCAGLRKLAWVVGHAKAQRTGVYIPHLLNAIGNCLARHDESIQSAMESQLPAIFAQLGPSFSVAHAEKVSQLFGTAMDNLAFGGSRSRAASIVIAQLAQFVPFILHRAFYRLARIIEEADGQEGSRLAGALNTFRLLWPNIVENLTKHLASVLQRLLCKVLCCLHSGTGEVLVASLEFLQTVATMYGDNEARNEIVQRLGQFQPLMLEKDGAHCSSKDLEEDNELCSGNVDGCKLAEFDSISVLSSRTGNSSKVMSAWSSLDDLFNMHQIFNVGTGEEQADASFDGADESEDGRTSEMTVHEAGSDDGKEEEENDRFSVISAELFVDPLMNCFHEQQKKPTPPRPDEGKNKVPAVGGTMTPTKSTIGRSLGRRGTCASDFGRSSVDNTGGEAQGIVDCLADNFCNPELSFWEYSSLAVARLFLLAGPGKGIRRDREVRVLHKILAMDYIASVALRVTDLAHLSISNEEAAKQPLRELLAFIGHEDDSLAMATLNLAMNMAKMNFFNNPSTFLRNPLEKSKLIWHLKKALHSQQSQRCPNRLKGLLQTLAHAVPMLCADDHLMAFACEQALLATHCDYFLVKVARAEFLSRIQWARASAHIRRQFQSECLSQFLLQLFDSDPRVQKATLEALPLAVRNSDFSEQSSLFASIALPHCLEQTEPEKKIPILLGLDTSLFAFSTKCASTEAQIIGQNLAHVLGQIQAIAMERFSQRQAPFLAALATLVEHFPPNCNAYGAVWLTSFGGAGFPTGGTNFQNAKSSSTVSLLPKAQGMFSLLLECVENIGSLDELGTLLRLIGAFFSGISESLILRKCTGQDNNQQKGIVPLWGFSSNNNRSSNPSAVSSSNNFVERCFLFLLRVLNLFYACAAEEQQQRHTRMAQAGAAESIVSGAAAILAHPSSLLSQGKSPSQKQSLPESDVPISAAPASNSKITNFSFLLGSGVKQCKPSSFTHSACLKALEAPLRGAYHNFMECLEPGKHRRYLEPFEALLRTFCAFLEVADLAFIRPLLDEMLIYLRVLMDVSTANSALMVHQLLKCVFGTNAQKMNAKTLGLAESGIWEQHHPLPMCSTVDFILSTPLNSFTLFCAFVGRTEFADSLIKNMGGWMLDTHAYQMGTEIEEEQCQQLNTLLHQFEPFITHLLKQYPLINSHETRIAVLNCVSSLCLCNVRYELLDRNDKLLSRVFSQLKQLSSREDAPLLPTIFAFLCVLTRIHYIKSAEVETFLSDMFARLDFQLCPFVLESVKIVLLDVASSQQHHSRQPQEHKRILMRIKELLCKEFVMTFQVAPETSAEVWILLLNQLRLCDVECMVADPMNSLAYFPNWSEASMEFIGHYFEHCQRSSAKSTPQCSPTRETTPSLFGQPSSPTSLHSPSRGNPIRQIFLQTILISQCAAEVLQSADNNLIDCIRKLFAKLAIKKDEGNEVAVLDFTSSEQQQIALNIGPLFFVLANQTIELLPEKAIETVEDCRSQLEKDCRELFGVLGRILPYLLESLSSKCNIDNASSTDATVKFLLFAILHCIRSRKFPLLLDELRKEIQQQKCKEMNGLRLGICAPSVWALWNAFLFEFDIPVDLSDFAHLPPYGKTVLAQLFFHKFCESPVTADGNGLPLQNDEFLVHLLRFDDDKTFRRFISRLCQCPNEFASAMASWKRIIRENPTQMECLLPRYCELLSRLEDAQEVVAKMNDFGTSGPQKAQIIRAFVHDKETTYSSVPTHTKFNVKEWAILREGKLPIVEFYKILASRANGSNDFRQICAIMPRLEEHEMAALLDKLQPWPLRKQFYRHLFMEFREIATTMANNEMVVKRILFCLTKNALLKKDPKICSEEKLFLLARIFEFASFRPELLEQLAGVVKEENAHFVEYFMNNPFVRILLDRFIEKKELPEDFFISMRGFFLLEPVKSHFGDNDCHSLDILLPFLNTLWDMLEKHIPYWRLSTIDKRHWPVQVQYMPADCCEQQQEMDLGELREQIHKMFALVQRIVFALENGMVGGNARMALQAMLCSIPLLRRMALMPEMALRSEWTLMVDVHPADGRIHTPLIQIHLLNDPAVLQDFCWRVLLLGWSSRSQFEEFCMSLYGVLSSTPTTAVELQRRAEADGAGAVQQQLLTSSLAIESLTNLLLQTQLFPHPGNPAASSFLVKHRKRHENFLFLATDFGKLALRGKALAISIIGNDECEAVDEAEFFVGNLEADGSERKRCYGIGQTSLYHLWSICGLVERMASSKASSVSNSPAKSPMAQNIRASTSEYLLAQSTELDTASSLRALFETFMHWLHSAGSGQLPLPILHSTLRSLALLSDLFNEPALYKQTWATIKPLVVMNELERTAKGFCIFLLLKCAAVLEWKELADTGELSTAKFIESLVQEGLLQNEHCQFMRIHTLHGLLFLLQSLALEQLQKLFVGTAEFVLKELQRMQQKLRTDILTDCPVDLMEYQKLCWAFAFGVLQEALPIDTQTREQFLQLVTNSFVDPRLPTWLKQLLTNGAESLVLHSCSYAPRFRQAALECLGTYQLQPTQLPFALSLYATCTYRELQEGGEYGYMFNKNFTEDFQKLLNIFSFYANSQNEAKARAINEFVSDLVSVVWPKEAVLDCLWTLLMPSNNAASSKSPKKSSATTLALTKSPVKGKRTDNKAEEVVAEFAHPLATLAAQPVNEPDADPLPAIIEPPLVPVQLHLSRLDIELLHLIHSIFRKLFVADKRVCMDLAVNFLMPKLLAAKNAKMARLFVLVLLCAANGNAEVRERVHSILQPDPLNASFFKANFMDHSIKNLVQSFIAEANSVLHLTDMEKGNEQLCEQLLSLAIG